MGALTRLPLRLRVFLFFAALALGAVAAIEGSLWFAARRAAEGDASDALAAGGVMAGFLVAGLVLAVWWLFDLNVAQAIDKLSADLRARAHGRVGKAVDTVPARYLGDLAPAAGAVAQTLSAARSELESSIAEQTRRLEEQSAQLSALLSDVPFGLLLCSSSHRLVFYNAAAVDLLSATGRPRLDRSVFDLLREGPVTRTYRRLLEGGKTDSELLVTTTGCARIIAAHMRLVSGALGIGSPPGYVLTLRDVSGDLRLHAERERLLKDTVAALRAPAASLDALLDLDGGQDGAQPARDEDIRREARRITEAVRRIAARQDARQDTWWPMQEVRASHLIDALRGQLGPEGPTIAAPTVFLSLRCDAFALVNLLAALIERAVEGGLARAFSIDVIDDSPGALIRIGWQGAPMPMDLLERELEAPLRDSPLAVTGREILEYHNTDIWPERGADGRAALVLPLPEARRTTPIDLSPDHIEERPTVFDFELLNRVPDGEKSGKRLGDLTYVVFDTETTGLEPQAGDQIVQIAAIRLVNGKQVAGETMNQLVDPERPIPAASTRVHGITDAMVAGAPRIDEVGARFHRISEHAVLVAHNAPFDLAFFHKNADRIGARFDHPVFDTVLLSAILFGQNAPHTLDALADRFGIVIPEDARHTALGDTIATAEVFQRMIPMLEARGLGTFDAVLDAMKRNSRLLREMAARVT